MARRWQGERGGGGSCGTGEAARRVSDLHELCVERETERLAK